MKTLGTIGKIGTGTLDFDILATRCLAFSYVRVIKHDQLLTIGMGKLIYFGIQVGLTWSQWLMIPPFIILGFVLFVLIEICISVAMFWTVEGWGINFLRMQFQQLARWPHFIYSYFPRKILTILIPVLLVGSGPVSFIYDVNQYDMLLGLVTAIFVFSLITKTLWRYGLNKYDSPSS